MYKIFFLFLLVFLADVRVYADLDSFNERVIEAEQEDKSETPEQSEAEEASNNSFALFLARLFGLLWYYDTVFIAYADYPYQEGGYIRHTAVEPAEKAKYYWFSLGLSGFYLHDIGGGPWISFVGNAYKFIGPYADLYLITDARQFQFGTRLGVHFSLAQFNPFNAGLYVQWQFWNGVLRRHGMTMGIELRLYPLKPISLRFKAGAQVFERFSIGELECELGLMVQAWECFAGSRLWTLGAETIPSYAGAYLGVRRYF
jgi:hypothetical protein